MRGALGEGGVQEAVPHSVLMRVAMHADAMTLAKMRASGRAARDAVDVALTQKLPCCASVPHSIEERKAHVASEQCARTRMHAVALARRVHVHDLQAVSASLTSDASRTECFHDFLTLTVCALCASGARTISHGEVIQRLLALKDAGASISPKIELRWWHALADSASRWHSSLLGPLRGDAPINVALRFNSDATSALLRLGAVSQTPAHESPKLPRWVQARYISRSMRFLKTALSVASITLGLRDGALFLRSPSHSWRCNKKLLGMSLIRTSNGLLGLVLLRQYMQSPAYRFIKLAESFRIC